MLIKWLHGGAFIGRFSLIPKRTGDRREPSCYQLLPYGHWDIKKRAHTEVYGSSVGGGGDIHSGRMRHHWRRARQTDLQ